MATLQEVVAKILGSIVEMGPKFEPVVTGDPLSIVSFVMGALLVLGASGVMGYLTFGALLELIGASPRPK